MSADDLAHAMELAQQSLNKARRDVDVRQFDLTEIRTILAKTVYLAEFVAVMTGSLADTASTVVERNCLADDRGDGYRPTDTAQEVVDDLRMMVGNFTCGARLATTTIKDLDHLHPVAAGGHAHAVAGEIQ